jgi:glycogen phosphorylase
MILCLTQGGVHTPVLNGGIDDWAVRTPARRRTAMTDPLKPFLPAGVPGIEDLVELALNLRSTWNHAADEIWGQLEPELWDLTHNPLVVLQTASRTKLEALAAQPAFCQRVQALVRARRQALQAPGWFQRAHPGDPLTCIAYFSMEFGLSEALPIYSGGLGNVAGDQLKTASDLGVPVVGVGLLYQEGYFRQVLDAEGGQQALYPYNAPDQLPITPVRDTEGEWLRLEFAFPGYKVWVRAWQAEVGRTRLYLLDSNDPANIPAHRGITGELYGGGPELRLKQELVLGIGGWRLLRALGLQPEVCHLNEGHAAFAVLERARSYMADTGHPFPVALAVTRAGNLFTTHTPVAAGFDRFAPALIGRYLEGYAENRLRIGLEELLALGRLDPADPAEPFNLAYLALRGSGTVNGVSRLHGEVSRRLFQALFPRWPEGEVPVGHVTNGVHMPTWDSAEADELWTAACGKDRWRDVMDGPAEDIRRVPDAPLWQLRASARQALIRYVRERLARELASSGATTAEVERARHLFDPNALTLGFARRFATYKRPNLLLHDPARLLRLLADPTRPVQLIIAGKAHPQDREGQAMVRAWVQFIRRSEGRNHAVFLADYDMLLAERLVQGVDLWINTPRRPWEASGTSGMKVLVNGGLNLSELDGWWAEAYAPEVGWALGDGREHGEDPAWDAAEAEALYTLLEREVIPAFYTRDQQGIPTAWVAKMRESMARLTPRFSAGRAVREYTQGYYLPAAAAYRLRAADKGKVGQEIVNWQASLARHWGAVRFGHLQVETAGDQHAFRLQVYLDELEADAVRVELYADARDGETPIRLAMARGEPLVGAATGYVYTAQVPAARPARDYTPRLVPHHPEAAVPLEAHQILWQG